MALELVLAIILIWFGIGAGIAAWIYADTKARKKEASWKWVGIGFLLSILGGVAYIVAASTEKKRAYEYPPTPKYENPKYDYQGEKHEGAQPAPENRPSTKEEQVKEVKQIEGLPRCRHCGAAVSEHDWQCPKCGAKLKY